jgi:hypothetical protein
MGYLKWSVFWLYAKILNQSALPFDPINNLKLFLPGGKQVIVSIKKQNCGKQERFG